MKNTASNKKRVCCLYRVSTMGQVDKDDIPMQKQCCHEYVERMGWEIVKEVSEKGISGFKVSAKDRDAIVELQQDALQGKFDVLLVYMFDRLGRRDDETPFVVEWFVKQNVEVWSTVEGQQRFDSQTDKLMNYIRYWQASGESIKTSIRVKTKLGQMVQAGEFTGGTPPYGYRLEKQGRVNKKKRELCELLVDENEAEVVRLIFQKYVYEGYGAQRLSRYLYEQGYRNRKGTNFANTTIVTMLKNPTYTGILRSGEQQSDIIPELQIVTPELFGRAKEIMSARTQKHGEVPFNSKGKALLSGLVYCGHCGSKLVLTTIGGKPLKDGSRTERRLRYGCHNKVRHPQDCDGQSGYGVTKLDPIVDGLVVELLKNLHSIPEDDFIGKRQQREAAARTATLDALKGKYAQKEKELEGFKLEIRKCMKGESSFDQTLLNELFQECKVEAENLSKEIAEAEAKIAELEASATAFKADYDKALSWGELYMNSSIEGKKMIVRQLIKKISVRADYSLNIELNLSYKQFEELMKPRQDGAQISA